MLQLSYTKAQKASLPLLPPPPLPSTPKLCREERPGLLRQPLQCINPICSHSQLALPVHSQQTGTFILALQGLQDSAINRVLSQFPAIFTLNITSNLAMCLKYNCPASEELLFIFKCRECNHTQSVLHGISPDLH